MYKHHEMLAEIIINDQINLINMNLNGIGQFLKLCMQKNIFCPIEFHHCKGQIILNSLCTILFKTSKFIIF